MKTGSKRRKVSATWLSIRLPVIVVAALGASALGGVVSPGPAHADATCDYVAAPGGSDDAPGTSARPFATAQKLANTLSSGQTGCLRAGTYREDVAVRHGGTPSSPLTITSFPGERATVHGRLYVAPGADYVTVSNLDLDGRELGHACAEACPSPTVAAAHSIFSHDDVTNYHTAICFVLGNEGWGRADYTTIENSDIHDCGSLPGNTRHGIYVSNSTGSRIVDNHIYDNANRGVQLYPDAQRTVVTGNVIDGNGQGIAFGGSGGSTANDNVIENNVISNSRISWNVLSAWPDGEAPGHGNVVRNNCLWSTNGAAYYNSDGGMDGNVGYSGAGNVVANPEFADRGAHDFRVGASSRCWAVLAGARAATSPGAPAPSPSGPSAPTGSPRPAPIHVAPTTRLHVARRVVLKVRARTIARGRHLPIRGRIVPGARFARRAVVRFEVGGHWHTFARPALHGPAFAAHSRIWGPRRGSWIRMRARVPGVGKSHTVRIRVRG